jgi:phosphonate transport system substrate-binding protein
MATFTLQPQPVQDKLKIIYETRRVAPHPVMAHPRVPAGDREKLRQAFLDMGATPEGQALLARIPMKKVVAAKLSDYRELADWGLEHYYVKGGD